MDPSDYPDRKYLKRISQRSFSGWQFAFERPELYETKFFNDKKFGGVDGAYKAAIKHRDEFLATAASLGVYDAYGVHTRALVVDLKLAPNNTSGIIGVTRTVAHRKNRINPEITWRASYKNKDGVQRQKGFSVASLGEKDALYQAVEYRRAYIVSVMNNLKSSLHKDSLGKHVDDLSNIMGYISGLEDEADVFFFLGTLNNPLLDNTTKKEMLDIRIGQNKFRKLVLGYWNNECAVTGASVFLTAGHIKPWSISSDEERIDVFNGLALSPVYDKAFDGGHISFDEQGEILVSPSLGGNIERLAINPQAKLRELNFLHQKYLEWHRRNLFKS